MDETTDETALLASLERLLHRENSRAADAQRDGSGYIFGLGISLERRSGQPWYRASALQARLPEVDIPTTSRLAISKLRSGEAMAQSTGDLVQSEDPPYCEYILIDTGLTSPARIIVWAYQDRRSSSGFAPSTLRAFGARARYTLRRESGVLDPLQAIAEAATNLMVDEVCAIVCDAGPATDSVVIWAYDSLQKRFRSIASHGVEGRFTFDVPLYEPPRVEASKQRGIVSLVRPESQFVVYDACDRAAWRPGGFESWAPRDANAWKLNRWRSVVAAPLTSSGLLLGAISLYSRSPAGRLIHDLQARLAPIQADLQGLLRALDERNRLKVMEDRFDREFEQHAMSLKVVTHAHDLGNSVRALKESLSSVSGRADLPEGAGEAIHYASEHADRIRELARMIADPARPENRSRRSICDAKEVVLGLSDYLKNQVDVVSDSRADLLLQAEELRRGYTFKCRMDSLKLERVLDNLVGNAAYWCRFSRPRGLVRVMVAGAPNEASSSEGVMIRVEDNGDGIAPESRPYIFDRFYSTRDSQGTSGMGVGLYLVKKYVQEASGSISVKSAKGRTTFTILVPAAVDK